MSVDNLADHQKQGRPGRGEPESPRFSDDNLARRFTARHADDLRYVAARSRWMQWDGTRWIDDGTLAVFDKAAFAALADQARAKLAA